MAKPKLSSSGRLVLSVALILCLGASRSALAESRGQLHHIRRIDVLGTDIDRRCLAEAALGQFEEADFADTPDELRAKYFTPTAPFTAISAIRSIVRFERRDMLSDGAPPGAHDLIVCRNVLIYFDRDTQERLFETFYQALAPGGFLVLGKVETLIGNVRGKFVPVDARERIFRRPLADRPPISA